MFDSIGWPEIFLVLIVAIIVIGPEKLPGVIKDIQAAIYAARRAIANARKELDGEFVDEFNELRAPLSQAAEWGRMGPKKAITKALFDGDESALDDFAPKKIMASQGFDPTKETPKQAAERLRRQAEEIENRATEPRRLPSHQNRAKNPAEESSVDYAAGEKQSWDDII